MMTESKVTLATVSVFERGLRVLLEKVEKLNKRAARHGMNTLDVRVLSSEAAEREVAPGVFVPDVRHTIEIDGCEPCIEGWALAAKIEFNDTIGNVVRIAPGRDDDGSYLAYRTVGPVCEHCNSVRRRNDIFVLEHCSGERKLVGRNCLADFVRSGDAVALAAWAEFMGSFDNIESEDCDDDDDWRDYCGRAGNPSMPLVPYLKVVAAVKRKFGWMGRTAARESYDGTATADLASYVIYGRGSKHRAWVEKNGLTGNADDAEYVEKAVEWACTLAGDRNEYRDTIGRIACAGTVDMRKLDGYAASILIAYDKHCEREVEYAARAEKAKRKVWFGCEGKREKGVRFTCVGLNSFEGMYGVTTLVRFEHYPNDDERAICVWFASGDRYNDFEIGDDYVMDVTVKGHDDHEKYGAQTKLNRCTVKAHYPAPAE